MQLYLYSSQDLIVNGSSTIKINGGTIYCLHLEPDENIFIFSPISLGIILINQNILIQRKHNQILFHELSDNALLCEIKPFILYENIETHTIKGVRIKIVKNLSYAYIYFNEKYIGYINAFAHDIEFEKIAKNGQEYGLIKFDKEKYIILFNQEKIVYAGAYIDIEITKDYIQIYSHHPNIFNIGNLSKLTFLSNEFEIKSVCDRAEEHKQANGEFNIIYFLDAIKCGRFKYAHNKLSYELKSAINIEVLKEYFVPFDRYIYLFEQDVYITIKNNKVVGIYHFVVKNNLIDNIY